jgi:hypothetical protein
VFTDQELRDALDSKGASRKCPSCDSQGWSTHGGVHVPAEDAADELRAYMLVCRTCGFIRLHAAQPLEG